LTSSPSFAGVIDSDSPAPNTRALDRPAPRRAASGDTAAAQEPDHVVGERQTSAAKKAHHPKLPSRSASSRTSPIITIAATPITITIATQIQRRTSLGITTLLDVGKRGGVACEP